MELDKVRVTPSRHVYEDEHVSVIYEHAAPCTEGNCRPYHRWICRDCTETQPCERMRALMGDSE